MFSLIDRLALNKRTGKWSQVDASRRKLNLRRDLRWVAKRTCKFPRSTRKSHTHKKSHFKEDYPLLHHTNFGSLANNSLMGVTQLALTWVGWGRKTFFDLHANLISTKVCASQLKYKQAVAKRSRK